MRGDRACHHGVGCRGRRTRRISTSAATRAAAGALLLIGGALVGCGRPPQVPAANLDYVRALRTAANTRDPERQSRVAAVIDRDHAAGVIGDEEMAHYRGILAMLAADRHAAAERACLRFLRAQLDR
jgi:hypothetical protein